MSDTRFLDLSSFSGLLDRQVATVRSAPADAGQQRWLADQFCALVEEIAFRAPSTNSDAAGEWDGVQTGDRLSLSGPGSVKINAVFRSRNIHSAWIDLNDLMWQVDAEPTPDISLRITLSRGHRVQSAFSFTKAGEIVDDRDWNRMLSETANELEHSLKSAAGPEAERAPVLGVEPSIGAKQILPIPDFGQDISDVLQPVKIPRVEPLAIPEQKEEEISKAAGPVDATFFVAKPVVKWELQELTGPQAGRRHSVKAQLLIGRKPDCDIVLDDRSVSRNHARFEQTQDAYSITDLGSSNGTFVNGQRIQKAILKPGDQIRMGDRVFQVIVPADEEPAGLATVIAQAPQQVQPAAAPLRPAATPAPPPAQPQKQTPPAARPEVQPQRRSEPAKPAGQPQRAVVPPSKPSGPPQRAATPPRPAGQSQRQAPHAEKPPSPPPAPVPPPVVQPAPPAREAESVICPKCGTAARFGINFCRNCGSPLTGPAPIQEKLCPYCRQPIGASARFCRHCGRNLPG